MNLRVRTTAASTCLALALTCLPSTVFAAGPKAGVMKLEGEGDVAQEFTAGVRDALQSRGQDVSEQPSLVELQLTMGCAVPDAECAAQSSAALELETAYFGSVEKAGEGAFKVSLTRITIADGTLKENKEVIREAKADDTDFKALADEMVGELLGEETQEPQEPVAAVAPVEAEPAPEPANGSRLYFGRADNTPTWKWVGLGVSGGLTLAALGTGIATTVISGPNGSLRQEIIDAAEASDQDSNPANDVSNEPGVDLCAVAQEEVEPGKVRNAEIATLCIRGERYRTAATVSWIGTGVFALSTLAFTGLIFIHREDSKAAAKLRRHRVGFGVAPHRDGWILGGSARF